jgi:hypothetical protein
MITLYVLAFRLDALRKSGRAPDAPTAREFIWSGLGMYGFGFIVSGRHKEIGDRAVSNLVMLVDRPIQRIP